MNHNEQARAYVHYIKTAEQLRKVLSEEPTMGTVEFARALQRKFNELYPGVARFLAAQRAKL